MKSKIDSFTEFVSKTLFAVKGIVEACSEGENSINKRNNQLLVNVTFTVGKDKEDKTKAECTVTKKPKTSVKKNVTKKKVAVKKGAKKTTASKNRRDSIA